MSRAMLGKAFGLAGVGLVLIGALSQINGLVNERRFRQSQAQDEVAASTALPQTVTGPYLRRQCTESYTATNVIEDDKGVKREKRWRETREHSRIATPSQLFINGDVQPQVLERGLFKVNTYQAQLQLSAQWDGLPELQVISKELEGKVSCQPTEALLLVTDARGLRSVAFQIDGQALKALPGSESKTTVPAAQAANTASDGDAVGTRVVMAASAASTERQHSSSVRALLPEAALTQAAPLKLELRLELLGTEALHFVPAAAQVQAALRSAWPHPSFQGRFLPAERDVADNGFAATWRVSELASNAAAALREGSAIDDHFGVSLIDPINPYSLSDRALKYGFLFITLTLAAVLLAELMGKRRLHPVQYGFVGLAMALFFLLLLALSEHLGFGLSYLIAASAATALLAHYASSLFGHWRGGATFGVGVGALYSVLYVVLNLEKAALLLGSGLLFALLAGAMVATRRMDWYALGNRIGDSLNGPGRPVVSPLVSSGIAAPESATAS